MLCGFIIHNSLPTVRVMILPVRGWSEGPCEEGWPNDYVMFTVDLLVLFSYYCDFFFLSLKPWIQMGMDWKLDGGENTNSQYPP